MVVTLQSRKRLCRRFVSKLETKAASHIMFVTYTSIHIHEFHYSERSLQEHEAGFELIISVGCYSDTIAKHVRKLE